MRCGNGFALVCVLSVGSAAVSDPCNLSMIPPPPPKGDPDGFGLSVALSGDALLVGAPYYDSFAGGGFVYRFNGVTWVPEGVLENSTPTSSFLGGSVALEGTLAALAYEPGLGGPVPVFRFDGAEWMEEDTIFPTDPEVVSFGESVAIGNGQLLISGSLAVDSVEGVSDWVNVVFVYVFDGTRWVKETELFPSVPSGADGQGFGYSIATHRDLAVIGARWDGFGAAYVYRFDGLNWTEEARLVALDGEASRGIAFGQSVAVYNDRIVVGAACCTPVVGERLPPAAYVFRFNGQSWSEEAKFTAAGDAEAQFFATSVALGNNLALIGSPENEDGSGAAYVYRFDGKTWIPGNVLRKTTSSWASRIPRRCTTELQPSERQPSECSRGLRRALPCSFP